MTAPRPIAGEPRRKSLVRRVGEKLLAILVIGFITGTAIRALVALTYGRAEPAGFWTGVAHGAMMPIALPNLVVGDDVPIYAPDNTGRAYKLGYIVGVDVCGALFFGLMFKVLSRRRAAGIPTVPPTVVPAREPMPQAPGPPPR